MSKLLDTMQKFSSAEEFLDFLGIEYIPQVVHVNRLHILKRFNQYLSLEAVPDHLPEQEQRALFKEKLEKAYADFVQSDAVTEKVFKVFQDKAGMQSVSVNKLKQTLDERRL